jgi:hypothetical protein
MLYKQKLNYVLYRIRISFIFTFMAHCVCCGAWNFVFVHTELLVHRGSGYLCCVGDEYMHRWLYSSLELNMLCTLRISVLFYLTNEAQETKSSGVITKSGVKGIPPLKFSSLLMGNLSCQLPSLFEFLNFVYNHRNLYDCESPKLSVIKWTVLPSSTITGVTRERLM